MSEKENKPGSLLAREATGGEIAQQAFRFQEGMLLSQLPDWLAQSGFSQLIREALGDTEARFFVPGKGDLCEFNEYKDHRLTPADFWPEIDRFRELDIAHPSTYRKFRLVCPDVNDKLRTLCREIDRCRRALPFYDGIASIEGEVIDELAKRVETDAERDREYTEFIFKKVEVDFEAPTKPALAFASFQDNVARSWPECAKMTHSQLEAVRVVLGDLIASRIAEPIHRSELVAALQSAVPGFDFATLNRTRIFTASEPESSWKERPELVFQWERFSGLRSRTYPGENEWRQGLEQLTQTRDWIISTDAPRLIQLRGLQRLSASLAIGSTFPATGGFVIEVEYRGKLLRTDQHSRTETPPYEWSIEEESYEPADEIAVVVSVKRQISADVRTFLAGSYPIAITLFSDEAIVSADQMNLAVYQVKKQISYAISKNNATVVHLFLAVPSTFALFLGHRLNAIGSIQCYEHITGPNYVPTFRIPCT